MDRKRVTRPSVRHDRAEASCYRADVDIVQQRIQREWEKGCRWACIAVAATFGPMIAWGIWWGW
jgi:hypothetical protein